MEKSLLFFPYGPGNSIHPHVKMSESSNNLIFTAFQNNHNFPFSFCPLSVSKRQIIFCDSTDSFHFVCVDCGGDPPREGQEWSGRQFCLKDARGHYKGVSNR